MSRTFFGIVMTSLQVNISATTLTALANATTTSISVSASNTGGGTLSYSWQTTGNTCTISTPSSSSTTIVGGGVLGTTNLFCNVTNSATGVTYTSPSCVITWTASVPGSPIIGASSAGDTTFTINWTAPIDDGGSTILGYRVQYSTDSGQNWSGLVDAGLVLSYSWSGLSNGVTYIGRALAYNAIGDGSTSGNSGGAVPTFAAPVITSVSNVPGYPTPAAAYQRPFVITFDPTPCVNYSYTIVWILGPYESFGSYSTYINSDFNFNPIVTSSSAAGQTCQVFSLYQQNAFMGGQYYSIGTNETYQMYVETFNTAGYSVKSTAYNVGGTPSSYSTSAPIFNGYSFANNTVQTITIATSAKNYPSNQPASGGITNYSIGDSETSITSLTIFANTGPGATICTSSRAFVVYFSGTGTSGGKTGTPFDGLQVPFSANSGIAFRSLGWARSVGYGNPGAGRITITGRDGSSFTNWSPAQNVYVRVSQQVRTPTYY